MIKINRIIPVLQSALFLILFIPCNLFGKELHVSVNGNDNSKGGPGDPLLTISAASDKAQPGDVITIHAGTYREWVKPARGGSSDDKRITYRAARGENVIIKGSERINTWTSQGDGVWMAELPNSFFGDYNPYLITMDGDDLRWGGWHHPGEVYLNGEAFREVFNRHEVHRSGDKVIQEWWQNPGRTWYCEVDANFTRLWAHFDIKDPNKEITEINVRKCVFFPVIPGLNYITVDGLTIQHSGNYWAPPAGHQLGAIGPYWSKGWIIENCTITDSRANAICLGTAGQRFSEIVLTKEVGYHIIRNNTILRSGESGICGNSGCAFSLIEGNKVAYTNYKAEFGGAEVAAIKFHGAVDIVIRNNLIHDVYGRTPDAFSHFGIWLDWRAQGTRITGNVIYNTGNSLFFEVNHGPILVDNNILLNPIDQWSEGCIFVHNIISGFNTFNKYGDRQTPYFIPHTLEQAGIKDHYNQNDYWYNNIFIGERGPQQQFWRYPYYEQTMDHDVWIKGGISAADSAKNYRVGNNVYYNGATKSRWEDKYIVHSNFNPLLRLAESPDGVVTLSIVLDEAPADVECSPITYDFIGKIPLVNQGMENSDGTPVNIDRDFFGKTRSAVSPKAGPFEQLGAGEHSIVVWAPKGKS